MPWPELIRGTDARPAYSMLILWSVTPGLALIKASLANVAHDGVARWR